MTDRDGRDALAQVLVANDGEVIERLRLSAAEAARVCHVTPRQLIYWTKKGLVRPSVDTDHDYDVFAMEKVIRIRQALERGHSLEKAAQLVNTELSTLGAEVDRLGSMGTQELEQELRRRLEQLEDRVAQLRRSLTASLTLARLRKAVAALARLESEGTLQAQSATGENARTVVLRLGRAVDEIEGVVREVRPAAV
ncbi:hypothetical protein BH18CHL2_BH18CHL2_11160 [soil metagenome]